MNYLKLLSKFRNMKSFWYFIIPMTFYLLFIIFLWGLKLTCLAYLFLTIELIVVIAELLVLNFNRVRELDKYLRQLNKSEENFRKTLEDYERSIKDN